MAVSYHHTTEVSAFPEKIFKISNKFSLGGTANGYVSRISFLFRNCIQRRYNENDYLTSILHFASQWSHTVFPTLSFFFSSAISISTTVYTSKQ